jgi:hypothetical protein
MPRVLKTFVLWLLVAALPMQGYAASSMAGCGPSHERMVAAMVQPHSQSQSHAAHDGMSQHASASEADVADAVLDDPGAEKFAELGQFKCSACAACCAAAALPAGDGSVTFPDHPPGTLMPVIVARVATLALDGPERPPRIFLA